jgi:hypothetical protein
MDKNKLKVTKKKRVEIAVKELNSTGKKIQPPTQVNKKPR